MIKINDKLKKLNDYTESVNPQSQQVPAIIPDVKNAYFNHTDLDPDVRLLWARAQEMYLGNAAGAQRSAQFA